MPATAHPDDERPLRLTQRWRGRRQRIRRFGLLGAVGCLAGALVGENLFRLLTPPPPPPPPRAVDVVFVLDVTGSMQRAIDGVKQGFHRFAAALGTRHESARAAMVAFRDNYYRQPAEVLRFGGEPFTRDGELFSRQVGELRAEGGFDTPESALDALRTAAALPFRPNAVKVLVLITDAPPRLPDTEVPSVEAAAELLRRRRIDQLHLVIHERDRDVYAPLHAAVPGEVFSLELAGAGEEDFARMLPRIGRQIALTAGASVLQSRANRYRWDRLLLVTSLWGALLALGLSLALVVGQNLALRQTPITLAQSVACVAGSLVIGVVAGAIGQLLLLGAPNLPLVLALGRIVAWALLGGGVGLGLAWIVPNLPPRSAALAGTIAGALGGAGLVLAVFLGEVASRLLGAALLGLLVGMMLALVEEMVVRPLLAPRMRRLRAVRLGKSYRVR